MKVKVLLGLIGTSIISANSLAMDITSGKWISHKEWATGNISGSFNEVIKVKNPKIRFFEEQIKKKSMHHQPGISDIALHNDVGDLSGTTGTDITLYGTSNTFVSNETSSPQTYKITSEIAVCYFGDSSTCQMEYYSAEDVITLDPQGMIDSFRRPNVTKNYDTPGDGVFIIISSIEALNGHTRVTNLSNYGYFEIIEENKSKK